MVYAATAANVAITWYLKKVPDGTHANPKRRKVLLTMTGIEVTEKTAPRVKCPYCQELMTMDIRPFQDDITKVMESLCPFCHRKLFTAMLVITHKNINGLMETLQAVFTAVQQVARANTERSIIDVNVRRGGN